MDQSTVIWSEDFEGAWPASNWRVYDDDGATNGEYFWANRCAGRASTRSAWGLGGGASGGLLTQCLANYPDGVKSVMVYGPLDLSRATAAELRFSFWVNTHCLGTNCVDKHDDRLWAVASSDINDPDGWNGIWLAGSWITDPRADANGWAATALDLKDHLGEPQVWIGFSLESDLDGITRGGGARVDDVAVHATQSTCPPDTATIRTLSTDRSCYAPGAQIGAFVDAGTSLPTQSVRAEALLLTGDIAIASGEVAFTAPGQRVIPLQVPVDAETGDYTVFVKLYDVGSECIQDFETKPVRIDPACGTATAVGDTPTPTATATPTRTMTPTRPPTHTPTPSPTTHATSCPPTRPAVPPSCAGPNFVRNPFYEKGARSWASYSQSGSPLVSSASALQGFFSARFEGPFNQTANQWLFQHIDIPADAADASFGVDHVGGGASHSDPRPPTSGRDLFRASLYDATLAQELVRLWEFDPLSECPRDPASYNLSPGELARVRGRTVALVFEFRKVTTTGWTASVLLDGIHLNVCAPSPPCHVDRNKTASPGTVPPGGEVTVVLSLTGLGGGCQASRRSPDVVLVLDRSGSMSGQAFEDLKAAAKTLVDRLDLSTDQVGVVSFSSQATLDQPLTRAAGAVRAAIDAMTATGDTNIAEAIRTAQAELTSPRRVAGNVPVMILMSDGQPTTGGDPSAAAADAKAAGTRVFTIGLGSGVDPDLMRALASAPGDYFYAPDSGQLDAIYQQIAGVIGGGVATNITIIDRLSQYVTLVPNSFTGSPAPEVSPDGRTLTWRVPRLGLETLLWSYRVRMTTTAGTWPTNDSATATFTNSQGQPGSLTFPVPQVTVQGGPDRHPQVMCRDHPADGGTVPSNRGDEAWWNSPDIWVRNARDGGTVPQNPIAGQTNWVYVRVRNIGDATVTDITVRVHSTAGGTNLRWPVDWVPEVGSTTIASLAAGAEAVVSVPWTPATGGHFCFLARIEAAQDAIQQDGWVPFDNNICQRNVHIVEPTTSGGSSQSTAGFGFGNRNLGAGLGSVTMSSDNVPSTGTCTVTFDDPGLFRRWRDAGGTVRGGQVVPGTESIRVDVQPLSPGSGIGRVRLVIDRVPLEGEETARLTLRVTGPAGASPPTVEISQRLGGQGVGGNIIRPPVAPGLIYLPYLSRSADIRTTHVATRRRR